MQGDVFRNLITVVKVVEKLQGHGWVEVIHCPYQGKDEGSMNTTFYFTYSLVTFLITFSLITITFFFMGSCLD